MHFKRLRVAIGVLIIVFTMSSCGVSKDSIKSTEALTLEEVATNQKVVDTNDEKEGEIYQYVSNSLKIDTNNLVKVDNSDESNIDAVINGVNSALATGDTTGVLNSSFANYMLFEMTKTPYAWGYAGKQVLGFDAATRLYFVDVTYKTTGTLKQVIPDSIICEGSPNRETLLKARYSDYIKGLEQNDMSLFTQRWGDATEIIDAQNNSL